MSYRPHPPRQSQHADNFISRQRSDVSASGSSAYSQVPSAFDLSRTSIESTAPYGMEHASPSQGNKYSGTNGLGASSRNARTRQPSNGSPEKMYTSMRQSLRPLPQPPAGGSPAHSTGNRHDRGKSMDISKLSLYDQEQVPPISYEPSRPRTAAARPNSMILTRTDSLRGAPASANPNRASLQIHNQSQVVRPDFATLGRSSTSQLRTLSKLAQDGDAGDFTITSPTQEVVGLRGRRRLQRLDQGGTAVEKNETYSWAGRNWMDKQRQFLQAYEYLCHIGEAKEWIEDIIHRSIPPIVELEEAMRDGVTLAEVVEALNPDRRLRIFRHQKLQYKHSDNINIFFRYLDEVELPALFRFELIDLYEKKNTPKVIYCIHALSWLLFRKGIVDFRIGNLVGQLEFEHHELEAMQRGLDKLGVTMPAFGNMGADFGEPPSPEPRREPEETEDERINRELAENEASIVDLQAQARGAVVRMQLGAKMQAMWDAEHMIVQLQSRIRGDFARQVLDYRLQMRRFAINLQSACRGFLARRTHKQDGRILQSIEFDVLKLQSLVRAVKTRKQLVMQRQSLERFSDQIQALQAIRKGNDARSRVQGTKIDLQQRAPDYTRVQAIIRAAVVRERMASMLSDLRGNEVEITQLQTLIRGMQVRQRTASDRQALFREDRKILGLQSRIRGGLLRKRHFQFVNEIRSHDSTVVDLQSYVRAMFSRDRVNRTLEELDAQVESIIELQAAAKAFLVRGTFAEKKRFFDENMQKVVKIQSFVRAKIQGEAYKGLTTGKNPPVGAVKNFVHLLNDSDFDFNEEVEFERMRKTVVQQVRQNETLEQYIDQLDIKIALLVKNKITLDEVVRHQSNFGGHAGTLLASSSMTSTNQFDLKALNKNSRKKLDSYQQLFFCLQTQSQYLARLFRRIRENGTAERDSKRIEHLLMGLFGYAQKRREEYYLLKLFSRAVKEDIDSSKTVLDFLRGNFFWSKLLGNYTRSPRDRKYLRDLLGPIIRDNIVEDPALDLESDPMQIYKSAINNEELRTGQPSRRPLDIPREIAITDRETRELFIDHLRDLREICDQFFLALEDVLPRLPYGLRYLCQQMFQSLSQRFKGESPTSLLQMVGNWFWRFYLQPALIAPENVGVIERQLSPLQKRNLSEVAKVLSQIFSARPFGGDNIYLQPLNAFVADSMERLAHILESLISVPDAESTFDIDEFNDLYAKNKPTLYIKMPDIFAIHSLIASELQALCTGRDDMLREIMQDLGSAKNNETEMLTTTGAAEIQLFLTPKLHDVDDPEAEVKALFMETKRCVLYIIRVQNGANLLDILIKPITLEDDHKWRAVLRDDFSSGAKTRGAYSDANMVDVTRMTYHELKRTALENVIRLEHMGRISKHNHYQDVLNAIALDIRTKSRRRVQRQRELEGVRLTLGNLHEKAKYLEQQRKSYDDYIEQAMATLQNKKGKKRFLLPFTRQYNHQRELERSGRQPKFGSYKYSARQLMDKGVLVSWSGTADRDWDKVNLTISCDQVGIFAIEGSRSHIQIPGASAQVPIEDLLQAQFESHQFMNLFEGNLRLNVNLLLHLLYKKFYRTQ